MGSVIN